MVMNTYIIFSLINNHVRTTMDIDRRIMSNTAPPVARHVSQKILHDEAQRTANADMGQFAPRRQAFDGALGDGEEASGLGGFKKADKL